MANLPPGLLDHVTTHSATYWTFYQRFIAAHAAFNNHFMTPLRTFIFNPLLSRLTSSPDLVTVALLIVVLFMSLKILDMLYRTILWWIRLITRLVFWITMLSVALWLWQRGIEGAMSDMSFWRDEWARNYQRFQAQPVNARYPNRAGR